MDILRRGWYHHGMLPLRWISLRVLLIMLPGLVYSQEVFHTCGRRPETVPVVRFASSVALVDAESGTVLYEEQGRRPWAPASLTKLVTIYTALEAVAEGRFSLADRRSVDPRAYASAVPPGSSLMFLGPDQQPDGTDLINGLIISSGNDAAIEIALRVSGTVESFVAEMNRRSHELGYSEFEFHDPAGLDGANRITAIDFARFSSDLLRLHPEMLDFTRRQSFTWPPDPSRGITQMNRNGLVSSYPGTSGLKTGFIEESGYNIAVSAAREDLRLIAVVLGVDADSHAEGARRREEDATAILDWGFDTWTTVELTYPPLTSPEVFGGATDRLELSVDLPGRLLLLRADLSRVRGELTVPEEIRAPIEIGAEVGVVRYVIEDCPVAEYPIRAAVSVEAGNLPRRVWDRLRWWWRSFTRWISSVQASWSGDSRSGGLERQTGNHVSVIPSIPEDSGHGSIRRPVTSAYPRGSVEG